VATWAGVQSADILPINANHPHRTRAATTGQAIAVCGGDIAAVGATDVILDLWTAASRHGKLDCLGAVSSRKSGRSRDPYAPSAPGWHGDAFDR